MSRGKFACLVMAVLLSGCGGGEGSGDGIIVNPSPTPTPTPSPSPTPTPTPTPAPTSFPVATSGQVTFTFSAADVQCFRDVGIQCLGTGRTVEDSNGFTFVDGAGGNVSYTGMERTITLSGSMPIFGEADRDFTIGTASTDTFTCLNNLYVNRLPSDPNYIFRYAS